MRRHYVFCVGQDGDTFDADHEEDTLGKWVLHVEAQAEIDSRDKLIAELEAQIALKDKVIARYKML